VSSDFAREACAWKFRAWSAGFTLSQTTEAGHPHQEWRGSAGPGERARLGRCRVRPAPDLSKNHRPSAAFFKRPAGARAGTPEGGRGPRDHWCGIPIEKIGGTTSVSSDSRAAQPHLCRKRMCRAARGNLRRRQSTALQESDWKFVRGPRGWRFPGRPGPVIPTKNGAAGPMVLMVPGAGYSFSRRMGMGAVGMRWMSRWGKAMTMRRSRKRRSMRKWSWEPIWRVLWVPTLSQ